MNPKVTVYIPTHRRPKMLIRAVESVLRQTYSPIEIIVSDDGTPQEDAVPMRSFLEENKIKYVRNESPKGACNARNKAIQLATGRYITGLDDDDEFSENRVSCLVEEYDSNVSFIATGYLEITSAGIFERTFDSGLISYDQLLHYNKVGNQVFTETDRLRSVGGFDERLSAMQDYDLWLRLCKKYGPARKIRDCTYLLHTEHEGQRISSQNGKLIESLALIGDKYQNDLLRKHRKTHAVLCSRLSGKKASVIEQLCAVGKDNWKMILSPLFRR